MQRLRKLNRGKCRSSPPPQERYRILEDTFVGFSICSRLDCRGPIRTECDDCWRPVAEANVKMSSVSSGSTPASSPLKRKRDQSSDSSSNSEQERTEVLSHAAKRKQRKALSKEAVPTKSPTEKKEEGASRPVKRENSIWVGNLCYKTTPESLRRFFAGVGEITRVHLPTKLGKASPGDPVRRENQGCVWFHHCHFSFRVCLPP